MQRPIRVLTFLSLTFMAATALAQPRASRRPSTPPARGQAKGHAKQEQRQSRQCESRRAVMAQQERELDGNRSELAGMDAEIAQLRRQLDQLTRDRAHVDRRVKHLESQLKRSETAFNKDCKEDDTCPQYTEAAIQLDSRGQAIEKELEVVQRDMQASSRDISNLERRIEPLRREYANLKCNDLVPGETSQTTIDRCSAIFSEWNRLQSDLNQQNRRVASLKSTYEQLLAELRAIESRTQTYYAYLNSNCTASRGGTASGRSAPPAQRNYGDVRRRAETLGQELDSLISTVTRLRGVRITVESR